MAAITFDVAAFRVAFPAFASTTAYPTATLEGYWNTAICIISPDNYGRMQGDCRERALWLLVCHLATIGDMIAAGDTQPAFINSSSVGQVSVSLTPPPLKTQFSWWLSITAYGQELQALLNAQAIGGFYVGGNPEKTGFRKWGGRF